MIKPGIATSFSVSGRYRPVYVFATLYVAIGALLRILLWWKFGRDADVPWTSLGWIVPAGVTNDLIAAAYLLLPLALFIALTPARWRGAALLRSAFLLGSIVLVAGMLFVAAVEYFFFEEFNARFNLVAFDYLMYPTEVIGDIRAEYPLGSLIALSIAIAGATIIGLRSLLARIPHSRTELSWRMHALPCLALSLFVGVAGVFVSTDLFSISQNRVANELAANGASSFVRAARTSEIDYHAFYADRDSAANFATLTQFLGAEGGKLTGRAQGSLTRHFPADSHGLGKLNVVVVVEEAFGSEFSQLYGSERNLTPRFDELAQQGMWFRHVYASGTRTVRGLEAISASFPPIPSVSILRRPNNEHIATWGSVMRNAGYATSFLYGGYGYFDNMNYFFANNGFEVHDRTDIERVRFANIWGVSDEDLFDRALDYFDERAATGQPFFSLIMTTSNHKPFTFRSGVPGVPPSGGGRAAGVRYADFALGYFIEQARAHRWFDDTLFIVVADHGARVYGKAEIPLRSYEIPLAFYAPKHLRPQRVDTLTGQIDVAPTTLGLLGLEYDAPFFGTNVLACNASCDTNRLTLFSHNYDVAAFRNGKLAVLGLGKQTQTVLYDRETDRYSNTNPDIELTDLAVAIYQTAYEQFQSHKYQ